MHLKVFVMEVSVGFKPTMGRLQRLALVNLATRPCGGRSGCRPHCGRRHGIYSPPRLPIRYSPILVSKIGVEPIRSV